MRTKEQNLEYQKTYYLKHPEKVKVYQHKYYLKHKAELKLARRLDYLKNIESYKLRSKNQKERKRKSCEVISPMIQQHQNTMSREVL